MDSRTLRKFNELFLTSVCPLPPDQIRVIRERGRVSQAVFACIFLMGLISQSERGEKHPAGASLKLLKLVQKKGLEKIA